MEIRTKNSVIFYYNNEPAHDVFVRQCLQLRSECWAEKTDFHPRLGKFALTATPHLPEDQDQQEKQKSYHQSQNYFFHQFNPGIFNISRIISLAINKLKIENNNPVIADVTVSFAP